ncbi:MAG: glutathione S-transferase family protein [Cyanobacteria bacterium J083]|nr:MAG: glutathione S-transferase family protein [Cyanobacteria bacterium J083]
MLELYQFELSQYSEKVRLILDYKGLEYRKIEVTPGVGQLELFRLSGKTQVPVLKDGDTFIGDSTAIAFYLEEKYPDKPLIPSEPFSKGQCLLIEEWADESIGIKGRKALIGALNQNPAFRAEILPREVPGFVKNLVSAIPSDLLTFLGTGVGLGKDEIEEAQKALKQDLEALCLILSDGRPYLVGDSPTLADLTVAGLSIILKFPEANYIKLPPQLLGKGIPGIADNPDFAAFFAWRDHIYQQYRRPSVESGDNSGNNSSPTNIEIE